MYFQLVYINFGLNTTFIHVFIHVLTASNNPWGWPCDAEKLDTNLRLISSNIELPSWKHVFILGIIMDYHGLILGITISHLYLNHMPMRSPNIQSWISPVLHARLPFASSGKCCGGCNSVGCLRGIRGPFGAHSGHGWILKSSIMMAPRCYIR